MPRLIVTNRQGEVTVIESETGRSVMQVIRDSGCEDLLAVCGGCCSCATCHVYVDPADFQKLAEMSADESDLLDSSSSRDQYSRLSCQIPFTPELDGLRVTIAKPD
jgi:2Fe-2S ferredoxin